MTIFSKNLGGAWPPFPPLATPTENHHLQKSSTVDFTARFYGAARHSVKMLARFLLTHLSLLFI